jgi:glycosyltransferase involved in cell wall biosynthesis
LGIPYVVSVHGLDAYSTEQKTGLASEWCARVSAKVYAGASRIICISEQVRRRVLLGGNRNYRTSVVYNGVDPELFSPHSPVPEPPLSIASVGNLIPIKGHELLLRAIARLRGRFPALRCEIVGSGPERHRLQRLASELDVAGRVQFLGWQSREDVARLLQRSVLFALPSRFEGLGCVYLEAMSTGLAVIGCREQGIEELIRHGKNGWLVGPGNLDELSNGLGTLLENMRLRDQIGQHARMTILQGLTLDHQARRLQQIYQECAV